MHSDFAALATDSRLLVAPKRRLAGHHIVTIDPTEKIFLVNIDPEKCFFFVIILKINVNNDFKTKLWHILRNLRIFLKKISIPNSSRANGICKLQRLVDVGGENRRSQSIIGIVRPRNYLKIFQTPKYFN